MKKANKRLKIRSMEKQQQKIPEILYTNWWENKSIPNFPSIGIGNKKNITIKK